MKFVLFSLLLVTQAVSAAVPPQSSIPVSSNMERSIGICQMMSNPDTSSITNQNLLDPVAATRGYFNTFEHSVLNEGASSVTVLIPPSHGTLEDLGSLAYDQYGNVTGDTHERMYSYRAESGYVGQDNSTFMVKKNGYKVKVIYFMHVFGYLIQDDIPLMDENCPIGTMWKISTAAHISKAVELSAISPTRRSSGTPQKRGAP